MDTFKLPDLGEGLADAEIHAWFVKEGDNVELDQPLVAMETAKAVVDVPCPQSGIIAKIFGKVGDIIKTGAPLVAFIATESVAADQGTVVGTLLHSTETQTDNFFINSSTRAQSTPAVRMLAKKLNIELSTVKGTGEHGFITRADVENAALKTLPPMTAGFEVLHGIRRTMLAHMVQSHQEVVAVSVFDEADIASWNADTDISIRLIQAMIFACTKESALNAWFDKNLNARKCFDVVNLALAIDSPDGLLVPVIHDAARYDSAELRQIINQYKQEAATRTLTVDKFKEPSITLSNFGKFAGRFASPIIVPPMVAILAVGRLYEGVVSYNGQICAHKLLPLSLSFDHRAVTGGEATRFLAALIQSLQAP